MRDTELTDFFAGLAMIGLAPREDLTQKQIAKIAYERADAMMEERKRRRRDFEERTSC